MADASADKTSGCGILNAVFGRRTFWAGKKSTNNDETVSNINNNVNNNNIVFTKSPNPTLNSKKRRANSDEQAFLYSNAKKEAEAKNIVPRDINNNVVPQNSILKNNQAGPQGRRVPKGALGISGELDIMIADHQKAKGGNNNLVRASSSNVMLYGNLGNLRQSGGGNDGGGHYSDWHDTPATNNNNNNNKTNVVNKSARARAVSPPREEQSGSLCRALSTRMDPETLKMMGNEDYKNGNFAEALALYDAAISIDPNKASYRSNKSAALTALGRILEAIFECREAIRIDPHYHRAHHRLASLYLRLGDVENAIYHFKHSGPEVDRDDISKAKIVQVHLNKCMEAKRLRDWNSLLKEASKAISSGADSAPQIFALQAEALLKLHRHQEADETLMKGPKFDADSCYKYFGPIGNANLLVVRAQIDVACGRFDEALSAIQRAGKLDANNREVSSVMRKAKAITAARSKGNEFYKAGQYSEACAAYGEGLEHDPHNSVLLCNRAACWSKLGQFLKAVEDSTAALNVRPGYSKARLRRADCNAKLRNWEASIQDYETLQKETPDDEEVALGLSEAKLQLDNQRRQNA